MLKMNSTVVKCLGDGEHIYEKEEGHYMRAPSAGVCCFVFFGSLETLTLHTLQGAALIINVSSVKYSNIKATVSYMSKFNMK